ncbi:carboxypeptidase-like regulatory domain-containing protein [Flavobacterium lacus]|uniref:Carboxypeptidase-like protein n=1 Tax=Flavobacterium lacus TaxID=1353778 RepID=A0A328X3M2_9FLAO|nr:carboxypeptidase-like regulatory domain-containing protein [Flavobacterium lacus]RAR49879.1 carboxypeptidase-like protein [Flavobacterium lacus]
MMKFNFIVLFLAVSGFLGCSQLAAQVLKGKIVDAQTQEPIGYASVQLSPNYGVISNQEGDFSLLQKDFPAEALVHISHIGYQEIHIAIKDLARTAVIALEPSALLLKEVVLGPTLTASQILQKYVENSSKNHVLSGVRVRYFSRSKETYVPKRFEVDLKKISFANKKELQQKIEAFEKKFNNREIIGFRETMTDVYLTPKGMVTNHLKALKLLDGNGLNMDNFQDKFFEHTFKQLESPYTYRINSGIIPLEKKASMKEISTDANAADTLKNSNGFYAVGYGVIGHREFIRKQDLYDYTLEGTKTVNGMLCYHLTFRPDRNRAKYVGELFINTDDFGLVYYKYELAPEKSDFKLNLKWMLGVKFNSFGNTMEVLMKKSPTGTYYPQFIKKFSANYVYIDRSLSFTENHPKRSERKKMKFNFLIEMNTAEADEIIAVEMEPQQGEVKPFEPGYIFVDVKRQYDPNYWSAYTILEATEAVRNFKGE